MPASLEPPEIPRAGETTHVRGNSGTELGVRPERSPGATMAGNSAPSLPDLGLEWLAPGEAKLTPAPVVLRRLLDAALISPDDWDNLPAPARADVTGCADPALLPPLLLRHGLLTQYQADCIESGRVEDLLLGNYRVLAPLGSGGMGVVYKAEHVHLRRPVAIKVLALSSDLDPRLAQRFLREMQVLARLQHPNIVAAVDAGILRRANRTVPALRYFVMEFIPGKNLEEVVRKNGPLPVAKACELVHQVAGALAEADRHQLVHRDIKPSNILITPEGKAKLLDFGLARHVPTRMTEPGTLLGSIDYISPEQACDAGAVDIRADIYGLGGTLFWCLTGQPPFASKEGLLQQVASRLTQKPPRTRASRLDTPEELDEIVARMMATRPEDRFLNPRAVMRALLPFLKPERPEEVQLAGLARSAGSSPNLSREPDGPKGPHVLLVTDDPPTIEFCQDVLKEDGLPCDLAPDGARALEIIRGQRYDLVLVDLDRLDVAVPAFCRQLHRQPHCPNLKVLLLSGGLAVDELSRLLLDGADEVLAKPPQRVAWQARLRTILRLKEIQDRADWVNRNLVAVNTKLKQKLANRDSDLLLARNAMVLGLAKLVRYREGGADAHLLRLERYCRCLAEEAARLPAFAGQIDSTFVELLTCCAPLHDIGKAGLPDYILMKPGKLEADERIIMQSHTVTGADLLKAIARQQGSPLAFLQMAPEIARHHHERFDGQGYPDGLIGHAIPLAARLVAVADVYDALRSRRVYKPALAHSAALQVMKKSFGSQFDPDLQEAFDRCAAQFEQIFSELPD